MGDKIKLKVMDSLSLAYLNRRNSSSEEKEISKKDQELSDYDWLDG